MPSIHCSTTCCLSRDLFFSNFLAFLKTHIIFGRHLLLQLCVWGTDGWEMQKKRFLQIPAGQKVAALSETRVQFHQNNVHFLAVHETQIAIYEAPKLECVKQVLVYYINFGSVLSIPL